MEVNDTGLNFFHFWLWKTTTVIMQVRICKEKAIGNVYAMKKLQKCEMFRIGQVLFGS